MRIGLNVIKRCEGVSGDDETGSFFKGEVFCEGDGVGSFCREGDEAVGGICGFPWRDFEEKLW